MSAMITFDFDGEAVRSMTIAGDIWFVGRDVCRCLDLANPWQALGRLDDDERRDDLCTTEAIGREQKTILINESGLYSLVLDSRKPEAKRFKKWVTQVVLPSIRKTGSYGRADLDIGEIDRLTTIIERVKRIKGERAARQAWEAFGLPDFGDPARSMTAEEDPALLASVRDFLDQCTEPMRLASVQAVEIYRAYCRWSTVTHEPMMTNTMFGRLLIKAGVGRKDGRVRHYLGLRLKAEVLRQLTP